MIVKRPSILIYVNNADQDYLHEICAGIEEEGILFEIIEREPIDLDQLAYDAAEDSMLGAGIGISKKHAALQMRHVPKGKNVYQLNTPSFSQCRALGANSARAIKKLPFKEIY